MNFDAVSCRTCEKKYLKYHSKLRTAELFSEE